MEVEYKTNLLDFIIEEVENYYNSQTFSYRPIMKLEYNQKYYVNKPPVKTRIFIYSRENEPPHFKVKIQDQACRFELETGKPMDALPSNFDHKTFKAIQIWLKLEYNNLVKIYNNNLPDDAPPQAKMHIN